MKHEIYALNRFLSIQQSSIIYRNNAVQQIFRTCLSCKTEISPLLSVVLLSCLYPGSGNHHSLLCFYDFDYFRYKWNHTVFILLWLAYFTYHNILKAKADTRLYRVTLSDYLSVLFIACYPLQVSSLTILTVTELLLNSSCPLPTLLICSSPRVFAVPVFLPRHSSLTQHDYLSLTIFKSLLKHHLSKASPRLISSKFQSTFSFLVPLSYLSLFIFFLYSSLLCVYYLFLYMRVKATSLMDIYVFSLIYLSYQHVEQCLNIVSTQWVCFEWTDEWMNTCYYVPVLSPVMKKN